MLVYIPIKEKSKVHGLWRDNGKTYFDKLTAKQGELQAVESLRVKYNQLAIFCTLYGEGLIFDEKNVKSLHHRHVIKAYHISKKFLHFMLDNFGGVTVYKRSGYYIAVSYN
jgi:hypothetical protein